MWLEVGIANNDSALLFSSFKVMFFVITTKTPKSCVTICCDLGIENSTMHTETQRDCTDVVFVGFIIIQVN